MMDHTTEAFSRRLLRSYSEVQHLCSLLSLVTLIVSILDIRVVFFSAVIITHGCLLAHSFIVRLLEYYCEAVGIQKRTVQTRLSL